MQTAKNTVITEFSKELCKMLREEIQTALDQIAARHGLDSIQLGNIGLSSSEFKAPVVAKVKAELNPEKQRTAAMYSDFLGYSANIVGLEFIHKGKTFKVLDIDLKKPKYPIICSIVGTNDKVSFTNVARLPFADKSIEWKSPKMF
jgi:hypothetical protein